MTVAISGRPPVSARRCPLDQKPFAAQCNQRSGKRAPQVGTRRAYRLVKLFELAEFDRTLIAGVRNDAAEKPQTHFGRKISELPGG